VATDIAGTANNPMGKSAGSLLGEAEGKILPFAESGGHSKANFFRPSI
jgi:hypothetical protein